MKSLDLLVCLKLSCLDGAEWTYAELAESIGMSASEANASVKRSLCANLLIAPKSSKEKPTSNRRNLLEFVEHGVRYCYSVSPGSTTRGLPTAHSAPPLNGILGESNDQTFVWPDPHGSVRGAAVEPLYKSSVYASKKDDQLYELLALVDAVRVGRARERKIAVELLTQRLLKSNAD
ncbi:MAG: hypothetical protein KDB61_01855 [Planctomycetes bacterium]|nr:hypothetical protein [Planctomycetota bacterium]